MAFAITALALLGAAAVSGTKRPSVNAQDLLREFLLGVALLFVVGAALFVIFDKRHVERSPGQRSDPTLPESVFDIQSEAQQSAFGQDKGAVLSFIDILTRPWVFRTRVAEAIDLVGAGIFQRVGVEFDLPESAQESKVLYIPVLVPRKGELLNGFRLTDGGDASITNLSYDETTSLIAVTLRALIHAFQGVEQEQWPKGTENAALILLSIITSRGPSEVGQQNDRIDKAIDRIQGPISAEARRVIRNYVMTLSASYPVVAVVAKDMIVANRVLLRYERTITPTAAAGRIEGSVRLGFKLNPREVVVPLSLALTAGSFHLRINAPQQKYLYQQIIRCRRCKQPLTHTWRGADLPENSPSDSCFHQVEPNSADDCHYNLERRRGQNFLHLYMRGYGAAQRKLRNLEAMAVFKEMPPGTRAAASVTALATTVFIWAAGYLISHGEVISNSDVPALLLALPAISASYFGFAADGDSVVGSSLLARISFVASGLLAVTAIVLYILEIPAITHRLTIALAFAGLDSTVWITLFALSTVNFLYVGWRFARKLRYYAMLINRPNVIDDGYRWH